MEPSRTSLTFRIFFELFRRSRSITNHFTAFLRTINGTLSSFIDGRCVCSTSHENSNMNALSSSNNVARTRMLKSKANLPSPPFAILESFKRIICLLAAVYPTTALHDECYEETQTPSRTWKSSMIETLPITLSSLYPVIPWTEMIMRTPLTLHHLWTWERCNGHFRGH